MVPFLMGGVIGATMYVAAEGRSPFHRLTRTLTFIRRKQGDDLCSAAKAIPNISRSLTLQGSCRLRTHLRLRLCLGFGVRLLGRGASYSGSVRLHLPALCIGTTGRALFYGGIGWRKESVLRRFVVERQGGHHGGYGGALLKRGTAAVGGGSEM